MRVFLIVIVVLFYVSSSVFGQKSSMDADELYAAGFYEEAVTSYKYNMSKIKDDEKVKNMTFLAMSYYHLHRYADSFESFSLVIVNFKNFTSEEKKAYFDVCRSVGQYDEALRVLDGVYSEEMMEELFITFAKDEYTGVFKDLFTITKSNADFGHSFLGMAINKDKVLVSLPTQNKESKTMFYDLQLTTLPIDNTLSQKELKGVVSDKVFYRGNPAFKNDQEIYYVQTASTSITYKDKKKDKLHLSDSGENVLDVYYLDLSSQASTKLTINAKNYNTVTPFYETSNNILFFSSDRPGGKGGYDIYYSFYKEGTYSDPINFEAVNTRFDDVYPVYYEGVLYFSSRGHANYGGLDMFGADVDLSKDDFEVAKVDNLGDVMNTKEDDFGLIWKDNNSGYFASNRDNKEGRDYVYAFNFIRYETLEGLVMDENSTPIDAKITVFKKNEDGEWVLEEELVGKAGVLQDFEIDIKEKYKIVFESEGHQSKTMYIPLEDQDDFRDLSLDNFKEVKLTSINQDPFLIIDAITGKPIEGATVKIYEIVDGKKVLVYEFLTDENCEWKYNFDRNKSYSVEMEARNYERKVFDLEAGDKDRTRFNLEPLKNVNLNPESKKDDVIRIQNIYFEFNSYEIDPESYPILDNIVTFLNSKPNLRIELSAHTDCVGKDAYNMNLSENRAKSCYQYLVDKGINKSRLVPKGCGETQILNGCIKWNQCTEEENAVNRRIEIKVL